MSPIPTVFRKLYEDPKYLSLLTLIAAILILYPTTNYTFYPYFLWIIIFNWYNGQFYSFFVNYNAVFLTDFIIRALFFAVILSTTALISIMISQSLAKTILKKPEEGTKNTELIQQWKTSKKIASTALILQYLTLIALIALTFLIWYNMLQQYVSTFLTLARYTVITISVLGILYLIHPTLDYEGTLAQSCLNIIKSIKEVTEKEDVKKIELVHFTLYILLNHALSTSTKELEEFNLETPLTTLYLALLQNEKETLTKAKTITTNLLKAITQQKTQDILKNLSEIDKKLGDVKELAKTMEISVHYPSLALYPFNTSKKITWLKAILPLVAQIPLAIIIFLEKWAYYTTFKL